MIHTVKSVGLAEAFPSTGDARFNPEFVTVNGMTFAQWLYGQNVAGFTGADDNAHIQIAKEDGTDLCAVKAKFAKMRTMDQLKSIADLLNELEAMEDGK